MRFAYNERSIMRKSSGEPKSIEAEIESSNSEEQEQTEGSDVPQADEPHQDAAANVEGEHSDDWWSASQQAADWSEPATGDPPEDVIPSKESGTADVYFCGQTTLFPLNRALQAIAKEKMTGSLRSFADQEPIDLLAQNGEILFATTRDSERYCSDMPAALANVDSEIVAKARAEQSETGTPLFLILAREEAIARQAAAELTQHYGQKLFSQLWPAPRVWLMFEKNVELPSGGSEVTPEPDVDDWALESLRFVQDLGDHLGFDARAIPAYTKDGFERVRKLQLTSDEAQFASQFNGARSVQQIAKNLRLDLKVARLRLFRFTALEIVECWPASTETKPEPKNIFQRFSRSIGPG